VSSLLLGGTTLLGQAGAIAEDLSRDPEWLPAIHRSYVSRILPTPLLQNSSLWQRLSQDGKLRLSVSDLSTLVRENNLDLLSAGYVEAYAETDLLRAKGGGAPRGGQGIQIPSSLFAGAIGAGLGDAGGLTGVGSTGGISGGARQVVIRPRGNLDPTLLFNFSVDHTTSPLNTIRVSGVPTVTTETTALLSRYVQAFVTGTSFSVGFNLQRQRSTQQYLRFNPNSISTLTFQFTQQLLNGFGRAANRRFLDVAENGLQMARESFRLQAGTVLAKAQTVYWDLVAAREQVRVAEASLRLAQKLLDDSRDRESLGKASHIDVVSAESELAARKRDLVIAETGRQSLEADLRFVLSKEPDSVTALLELEAVDPLPEPQAQSLPAAGDGLATALRERPELRIAELDIENQAIAVKYTDNLLKPNLTFFGQLASAGLSGRSWVTDPASGLPVEVPGGMASAFCQVTGFDYPDYAFGFSFSMPFGNDSAKADSARARLEQRQSEAELLRTRNQVALEVRRAEIALRQAREQALSAASAVRLATETLAAEEERLFLGVSTPYEVIRKQRDLVSAQTVDVVARAGFAKAMVEYQRATGVIEK